MNRLFAFVLAVASVFGGNQMPRAADAVILFEGARLIVGDGTTIEHAAFSVVNGHFAAVDRMGRLRAPGCSIVVSRRPVVCKRGSRLHAFAWRDRRRFRSFPATLRGSRARPSLSPPIIRFSRAWRRSTRVGR